ncbi:hypothetical protein VB734_11760 [Synechococcus sp. BA-124 BA4]|uniref:hypothetical protein n=1 Tax=Synechococcus sp. BA-124 BA4 TaxID=3110251 RepID=UPI002B1EA428|nr:hypothetical protein [Synechococcus sp. BA-124 BA4]MEA5400713.1 hypothetical protein [Synechococcus sp. BA-124 BA4]MEA5411751.1 hypothetical protein [Synechococcus sp. BA-120 BA3]
MLAAVLQAAGISMGEQTATGTHEDQQLAALLQQRRRRELQRLIRQRDDAYALWGFKLPSRQILEHSLFRMLKRPYLVVIFRDILAIAGRRQVSRGEQLMGQLTQSLSEYHRLLEFLKKIDIPCLLISYEKALLNPDTLIDQLDCFLDLNLDGPTRSACRSSIEISPEIYRREVRNHQGWQGRLEEIHRDKIMGWAFVGKATVPATVEILINGFRRYSCRADKPRPDVQKEHQLETSACGFCLELDDPSELLQEGDRVSGRVATMKMDLRNSPLTF